MACKFGIETPCNECGMCSCQTKFDNYLAKEIVTNADRIKSMSVEELAELLRDTVLEGGNNLFKCEDYMEGKTCNSSMCYECMVYLDWLKEKVE